MASEPLFAGDEDVGAGGAFRVGEGAVLLDDELAAQGDHEEHAEPAADEGEHEDAGVFELEAEEDQRGQGEDDAGGDGLAGVAGGLDDVVFKDGGAAEGAQDADGENGDGNGGGDGESGAEAHVDGDGAEDDAEEAAEEESAEGELGQALLRSDEALEGGACGRLDFSLGHRILAVCKWRWSSERGSVAGERVQGSGPGFPV